MAEDPEELRPDNEEEDGGGPVKSFLEHLEDLRWTLIKCAAAVTVGFVVCLAAGDTLMKIIKWPLEQASKNDPGTNQWLTLVSGTNRLSTTKMTGTNWGGLALGTNRHVVLELMAVRVDTNYVLALQPSTNKFPHILPPTKVVLLNLTPAGGFFVAFQLAVYGGIVLASPFILYFVGQFLVPALKRKEKHYFFRGFIVGLGLFLGGVAFCYFALMPLALNASQLYSNWLGIEANQWTAEAFISFECKFMLGMGLGFELPVILLILVKLGILDYAKLAAFRRYMIVINLVLGAVLTTPEVLTQIMMAVPLQVLYEITIWIAWYWERQDKKRLARENQNAESTGHTP